MEYQYQNLVVGILPHPHGCELRFRPDRKLRPESGDPPKFSLLLTREGFQVLAEQVREFEEYLDLFES